MNRRSFIGRALAAIGALVGLKGASTPIEPLGVDPAASEEISTGALVKIQYVSGGDQYKMVAYQGPDGWVECNATSLPADQWIGKKPKGLTKGQTNA